MLQKLLGGALFAPDGAERVALQRAAADYSARANELLGHFEAGRASELVRLRDSGLLPAFDHYLATVGRVSDQLAQTSLRASDETTVRIGRMSTLVLGIASWPVILLVALLLLTAVFVIVLMILFRGRETSDMP